MSYQGGPSRLTSRSISMGAEGIAAAQFARTGFDILPQAAQEKPNSDLVVTRAGGLLKVSVRATVDGRWDLVAPYLRGAQGAKARRADHQNALDMWLDSQSSRAMCCLVQFGDVPLEQMPRIYLAAPADLARRMLDALERMDEACLFETYEWVSPFDQVHRIETLPNAWKFSPDRIQELLTAHQQATAVPTHAVRAKAPAVPESRAAAENRSPARPLGVLREVALSA